MENIYMKWLDLRFSKNGPNSTLTYTLCSFPSIREVAGGKSALSFAYSFQFTSPRPVCKILRSAKWKLRAHQGWRGIKRCESPSNIQARALGEKLQQVKGGCVGSLMKHRPPKQGRRDEEMRWGGWGRRSVGILRQGEAVGSRISFYLNLPLQRIIIITIYIIIGKCF